MSHRFFVFRALLGVLLSAATLITAPVLAVDTVWNFNGTLSAASGPSTMQYRGDIASMTSFGTTDSLGLPRLDGDDGTAGVMVFPTFPSGDTSGLGYTVMHRAGAVVPEYTMIWDVLYPESSDMKWRALYQTSPTNTNDADLFVNAVPWGGVGISGTYHGVIKPGEWNRIAITRDAAGTMMKYINGGYVGEQSVVDNRWRLGDTLYHILTDDNGNTAGGYIASHRFVDRALTQHEIFQLGGAHAAGASTAGPVFADASAVEPGSFTIAVLGDTQSYSKSATHAPIFNQMTQWLVDNKDTRNIQFVMHVGDIVDANQTVQWDRAASALATLDGQIPYALVPGNHDYGGSRTVSEYDNANRFGPGSAYASQPTLTGYYPAEPGSRMNTYHTFNAAGQDFLIVALEFGPRDAVVEWAKTVVDSHPNHRAILLTHAYMYNGGYWFDHSVYPNDPWGRTHDEILDDQFGIRRSQGNPHSYSFVSADCNDGRELWDKLVNERENFEIVMTGHQFDERCGFPYLTTQGEYGNKVYQMLFNTQTRSFGGEGWIQLLEFSADGKTVTVKTYSPLLDQWSYASDEYCVIELSPVRRTPGDANGDGVVDEADAERLAENWGATVLNPDHGSWWKMGDFNGDGKIDARDAAILAAHWGSGDDGRESVVSMPEPTFVALLVAGLIRFLVGGRAARETAEWR